MATLDQQTNFHLTNRNVITGPSTVAIQTLVRIFNEFSRLAGLNNATPDRLTFLSTVTDSILYYAIENGTSVTNYHEFDFTVRLSRTSFNIKLSQYFTRIERYTTFHRFCLSFSRRAKDISNDVEPTWCRLYCSATISRDFSFSFAISHPDIDNLSLGSILSGLVAEYKRVALVLKDNTTIDRLRRDSLTGLSLSEPLSGSRLTEYYHHTIEAMLNLSRN